MKGFDITQIEQDESAPVVYRPHAYIGWLASLGIAVSIACIILTLTDVSEPFRGYTTAGLFAVIGIRLALFYFNARLNTDGVGIAEQSLTKEQTWFTWQDIQAVRTNYRGHIQVTSCRGESIDKINRFKNYPQLLALLYSKRPDLAEPSENHVMQ
jgi:hypothetical protein